MAKFKKYLRKKQLHSIPAVHMELPSFSPTGQYIFCVIEGLAYMFKTFLKYLFEIFLGQGADKLYLIRLFLMLVY